MLFLFILVPTQVQAVDEGQWDEAVTIYGASLESDAELQERTSDILNVEDGDIVDYVYSEDLEKYLGYSYDDSRLKSSIRIIQRDQGHGLNITIDESIGSITMIAEETYQNALLTSGITDADVTIGSAEDVTGETALSGIYKAYESQGEEIDSTQTQNAQQELETINDISEENSDVDGFSQEQLNKAITEIKIQVVNEGNDMTDERVGEIVDEKLNENGLDGLLSDNQREQIIIIINNARASDVFSGENAERLLQSSQDLVEEIQSSEGFQDAVDRAGELGQDIQESGAWESFVNAIRNFFKSLIGIFTD